MAEIKTAITEKCRSQDIEDFIPYEVENNEGKILLIDNENYVQYSNGAIACIQNDSHAIVAMDINGHRITKETASEYANKYWKDARIASQKGIARAARQKTGLKGWEEIVYHQAMIALDGNERSQDRTNAARFVGKVTGFTPSNVDVLQEREDNKDNENILVSLPKDSLLALAEYLRKVREENKDNDGLHNNDVIDM